MEYCKIHASTLCNQQSLYDKGLLPIYIETFLCLEKQPRWRRPRWWHHKWWQVERRAWIVTLVVKGTGVMWSRSEWRKGRWINHWLWLWKGGVVWKIKMLVYHTKDVVSSLIMDLETCLLLDRIMIWFIRGIFHTHLIKMNQFG